MVYGEVHREVIHSNDGAMLCCYCVQHTLPVGLGPVVRLNDRCSD